MPSVWHLGNDVLDLADPRCRGKAEDDRFLARVFDPEEENAIRQSADPEMGLWMRWAGKEAAFKSVSKALGTPPFFDHSAFRVEIVGDPGDSPIISGLARYQGFVLALQVERNGSALHAQTWTRDPGGSTPLIRRGIGPAQAMPGDWRVVLRERFSFREWACVSHLNSALARLATRQALAVALGLEETRLEVGCRPGPPGGRIPLVLLDGREAPVDLSLSHHGGFLAWAFVLQP